MKLFIILFTAVLMSCAAPKYNDILEHGRVEKILQKRNGKAILQVALPSKTVYVYYYYKQGQRFKVGQPCTLLFKDSSYNKAIVTFN